MARRRSEASQQANQDVGSPVEFRKGVDVRPLVRRYAEVVWGHVQRGQAMSDTTVRSTSYLDRTFGLSKSGTDVRTEFIAGLTTFLTMV